MARRTGNRHMNEILVGDAAEKLREIPDASMDCCVTSPPYFGLRDYGVAGQIGLERTPEKYLDRLISVFREVRRVLRPDGTAWVNIGDCYASAGCGGATGDSGLQGSTESQDQSKKAYGAGPRIGHRSSFRRDRMPRQDRPHKAVPGLKVKDLVGIPWRLAFALQADGWWLRSDIIWEKTNPMPESILDRPTRAHEYVFLLSRAERYYYDADAIREGYSDGTLERYAYDFKVVGLDGHPSALKNGTIRDGGTLEANPKGRNKRSVWTIPTSPFPEAHFATFPEKLVEPCILAGSRAGGGVLDPFMGAGTTALVALKAGRRFMGVELNPEYAAMARKRIEPELTQLRLA
jgi:DNA modification methylase